MFVYRFSPRVRGDGRRRDEPDPHPRIGGVRPEPVRKNEKSPLRAGVVAPGGYGEATGKWPRHAVARSGFAQAP